MDRDGVFRIRLKGIATVAIAAIVSSVLGGCGALRPDIPELQCIWKAGDATVILHSYGQVFFTDLALDVVQYPFAQSHEVVWGDGTWRYGERCTSPEHERRRSHHPQCQ